MPCWADYICLLTTLLHAGRSSIADCFVVIGSLNTGSAVCIITLTQIPELRFYFHSPTAFIIAGTISNNYIFVTLLILLQIPLSPQMHVYGLHLFQS